MNGAGGIVTAILCALALGHAAAADALSDVLEHDAVCQMAIGERRVVEGVELSTGERVDLRLERFEIMAPDGVVVVADADGEHAIAPDLVLLRGKVRGEDDSRVFLGVSSFGSHGYVQRAGDMEILSTGHWGDDLGAAPLAAMNAADVPVVANNVPVCDCVPGVHGDAIPPMAFSGGPPPCRTADIAIDTDWEFTNDLFGGDTSASSAYALTLLAAVSEIYDDELNVEFQASYVRVWASNSDPYPNGGDRLDQMRTEWNTNMTGVSRDLAHLFSGRDDLPYGGVAWVSVVCHATYGYGVSAYLNGTFPYPLQDNHSGNWDIVVVAHELGHNFGAVHTHDFNPPIDGCGLGDCSQAASGTIMSYCHGCSGGLTNIALDFHPLVRDSMLAYLETTCDLTGGVITAVDDEGVTYEDAPVLLDILLNDEGESCGASATIDTFDATSTQGGTVYYVPASGWPREQFTYIPPTGFTGMDSFTYTLVDGGTALVDISVLEELIDEGAEAGLKFGSTVAAVGDMDNDGTDDFAIAGPGDAAVGHNVFVMSGDDGGQLHSWPAASVGESFGSAVANAGDVDGDGFDDIVIGAYSNDVAGNNRGAVYVMSGQTGAVLQTFYGEANGDQFGYSVAGGIDVDGDTRGDFLVGAPKHDTGGTNAGRVYVYSGATMTLIRTHDGGKPGDRFGFAVAAIGAMDGDLYDDYIVGAPRNDASGTNSGKVYVYSGFTGVKMYHRTGANARDQFGRSIAAVGFVDGDGFVDFVVGSPFHDASGKDDCGRVDVYSGATGSALWSKTGSGNNERAGWAVAGAGDADGDGTPDVVIGSPWRNSQRGRMKIRSGDDGSGIMTVDGDTQGDRYGYAVAGIGNLTGTGFDDVIVGAPNWSDNVENGGRSYLVFLNQIGVPASMPVAPDETGVPAFGDMSAPNVPDEPETGDDVCRADLDRDGSVATSDLVLLVGTWGPCVDCPANDVDGNGEVDARDLLAILVAWGPCE